MKFQGLPAEMQVGAADLTLLTPCQLIDSCICMSCKRAGPSFFVCGSEHIICATCSIPGPGTPPTFAWCPGCQRRSRVTPGSIPSKAFSKLSLLCNCGFEGSLTAIREHLLDEGAHDEARDCVALSPAPPPPGEPIDPSQVRDMCRLIVVREIERMKQTASSPDAVNELKQEVAALERDIEKKLEEVNEKMATIEQNRIAEIDELKEQIRSNKEVFEKSVAGLGSKVANQIASATKAFFWFDFDKLQKKFGEAPASLVSSEWQYKVIAAICFGAVLRLEKINDTDYIGLLAAPKNKVKTGFAWPVSRRITLSVLDKNGLNVVSKFYDYVYQSPQGVGAGFLQFMDTHLIHSRQCLVQGKLCVTLEVGGVE